jgi:hypothetical protein
MARFGFWISLAAGVLLTAASFAATVLFARRLGVGLL